MECEDGTFFQGTLEERVKTVCLESGLFQKMIIECVEVIGGVKYSCIQKFEAFREKFLEGKLMFYLKSYESFLQDSQLF